MINVLTHNNKIVAGASLSHDYNQRHYSIDKYSHDFQGREINLAAFRLARQVADEGNALVSVSLSEPLSAREDASEEDVKNQLREQIQFFVNEKCDIDFVACEVRVL